MMSTIHKAQNSQGRELGFFFTLTFLWTWTFWILRILILNNLIILPISEDECKIIGGLGPLLVAFILTYLFNGKEGIVSLLKRGVNFKFGLKWWIPLLLLTTITTFIAYQLVNLITPIPNIVRLPSNLDAFTEALFILILISVAEEFGWRGFALDRLQSKFDTSNHKAVISSIVLGILWVGWHLPLFLTPGEGRSHEIQYFPLFLVMAILLAIIFTWFYNNTNGSILTAIIFHTTVNFSGILIPVTDSYAIPSSLGYLALNSLILGFTILIVKFFGSKNLVKESRNQGRGF
ncbi:MAG: CPBP family intramembrane glutamic endopeptidase [Candidatus Hodarchaeales archaeon]